MSNRAWIPNIPRPPALPMVVDQAPEQKYEKSFAERLADLDNENMQELVISRQFVSPVNLPIEDGATLIPDRATFETLSHRDDVPGALGVREVKYLVTNINTLQPQIYFLNTNTHQFHYLFARDVLNVQLSNAEFNRVTYFSDERRFLAGTILAHDTFEPADGPVGLYAVEFWPTDPVKVGFAATAYELALGAMPFATDQLAYHPSGAVQEDLYAAEESEFAARNVRVVSTDDLFASMSYSPLNLGVGFGRLRVIDGADPQPPTITTVVIFKTLPNDLSHVAGVLSEEPQTPLSHVNLRAKQNDTPNAYLRNAASDAAIAPLIGSTVRFEVKSDAVDIRAATQQEVDEFLEAQRPTEPQFPPRDLTRTEIVDLDAVGHADLVSIGAKAANVAELRKILAPTIVPEGFAVPFHFYDRFMVENGLYDEIRTVISKDEFRDSEQAREDTLKKFRKAIKRADIPSDLRDSLGELQAQFRDGTNPRCRSSTNNEDLVGFNGAGLYDSFTHRPDEGHIEKSIKQVWASLWNFRAFEEREFYRIDHFTTTMAVLVHQNFDDELANGVALTKNIYFPDFAGFYVNVQVGEALVTNPDPNAIAEELLIMDQRDLGLGFETIRIRRSSLVEPGTSVINANDLDLLIEQMELIQRHFKIVYGAQNDSSFAMDLEFKIKKNGALAIKQARPWVD